MDSLLQTVVLYLKKIEIKLKQLPKVKKIILITLITIFVPSKGQCDSKFIYSFSLTWKDSTLKIQFH